MLSGPQEPETPRRLKLRDRCRQRVAQADSLLLRRLIKSSRLLPAAGVPSRKLATSTFMGFPLHVNGSQWPEARAPGENSTPSPLRPKSQNPKPENQNPKPKIRHPKPKIKIKNPKPNIQHKKPIKASRPLPAAGGSGRQLATSTLY